jgi:hypothetical protein
MQAGGRAAAEDVDEALTEAEATPATPQNLLTTPAAAVATPPLLVAAVEGPVQAAAGRHMAKLPLTRAAERLTLRPMWGAGAGAGAGSPLALMR